MLYGCADNVNGLYIWDRRLIYFSNLVSCNDLALIQLHGMLDQAILDKTRHR